MARYVVVDLRGRVHCSWETGSRKLCLCVPVQSFIAPETSGARVEVLEDNQGAEALIENPLSSSKSNHTDVRFHFLRDLFRTRKTSVEYLASTGQDADILTKALSRSNSSATVSV